MNRDLTGKLAQLQKVNEELRKRIADGLVDRKRTEEALAEASAGLLWSDDGRRSGIIDTTRDSTERKRAEEELRLSEEKFAKIFRSTPDSVTLTRLRSGEFLEVNDGFENLFGYSKAEALGKTSYELGIWADQTERERLVELVGRNGRVRNMECLGRRKSGEVIAGLVSAEVIYLDREACMLLIVRDVSEAKRAEEALRESERKLRDIAELTPQVIYEADTSYRVTFANKEAFRILGVTEEEFEKGINLLSLFPPEEHPRLRQNLERLFEQGFSRGNEYTMLRRDGSRVSVISYSAAIMKDGALVGFRGVLVDITERKNLEAKLLQAQKMEAIGTLAGGIAHDFNNILTVILGLANLVQMRLGPEDPNRPYIDQIVRSSEKAAELTQSLLAYSRKQHITLGPRPVAPVIANATNLLKRLLPEDIRLELRFTDDNAVALVDANQVEQILMNLATNARDAMPNGGSLVIGTERASIDESFVQAYGFGTLGPYVRISVSDTGVGMDARTMARVFDPFFTTKEVGKGTGLGLSSVYGIVKQHNGYITVTSSLLKGTTFHIYLPLVGAKEKDETDGVVEVRGGSETVLLIEDHPEVRNLLKEILSSHGYVTLEAANGNDAVRMFLDERDRIGVIVADVVLPGKNGREVLDEITRIDPGVKAIFMSGYTGDILVDKGVERENVDFLQKPISPVKLLSIVREVLDR